MKLIGSLNRAEIKMMLNYLGIEISEQPVKIKELRGLLQAYQKNDQKAYKVAYEFVVEQKSPGEAVERVLSLSDARDIISSEIGIIKNGALSHLENSFKKDSEKFIKSVYDSFRDAVEIESKKYNIVKHVIYSGSKKVKEISGVAAEDFETLLQLGKERINILMVGPSGCGKTYLAEQLSEALDLDYSSQSCSSGVSESSFSGKLLPLGDHGRFEYVESDFVRMYEKGGVFLFDEIDAADANVLVFLNQALSSDGFHCPQRFENTYVKKHEDFLAIASANTFGTGADSLYSGRNSLDAATLDRFRTGTVVMDYSPAIEESIVDSSVLKFGRILRQKIKNHRLKKILSTRFMKDATTMKNSQNWSMDKIQDVYFADWSLEELAIIEGKFDFNSDEYIRIDASNENIEIPEFAEDEMTEDAEEVKNRFNRG